MHARCAGLDVHKKTVVACVMISQADGSVEKQIATFGTMTPDILAMSDWLKGYGVTHAAMESTGVYWRPIYQLLEGQFTLLVANAQHIKRMPGRKTDVEDAEWLADLLRHGLIAPSFVPAQPQRGLRELTRHRSNVAARRAQCINEVQRTLEGTNINSAVWRPTSPESAPRRCSSICWPARRIRTFWPSWRGAACARRYRNCAKPCREWYGRISN
jgi:transposase